MVGSGATAKVAVAVVTAPDPSPVVGGGRHGEGRVGIQMNLKQRSCRVGRFGLATPGPHTIPPVQVGGRMVRLNQVPAVWAEASTNYWKP